MRRVINCDTKKNLFFISFIFLKLTFSNACQLEIKKKTSFNKNTVFIIFIKEKCPIQLQIIEKELLMFSYENNFDCWAYNYIFNAQLRIY